MKTDWQSIPTAASGLKPQMPGEPIQFFRVKRVGDRALVDLTGLRLDTEKPGLANLGHLPDWMRPELPHQYHWVNDSPTSLHPSLCSVYYGRTLYWHETLKDGMLQVQRPTTLRGGFEYTCTAPIPPELIIH
ncbi:hypothetical protein [Gulosibacter faecalis]|uniref:Uncharacterized protein n=1 Tax=Gulosibacter faecalis TaxID=272240 RepID=A0ABW5UXR1_9MICO|nr:hypothetical protein [Gulosibacter faecalis]